MSPVPATIPDYLRIGVEHILSGWDHLAFVVALILLATSVGEVARLVTGFTLAHSVTLALAVLGVLNPETAAVEALIGFSIALVAAENGWLMAGGGRAIPVMVVAGPVILAVVSFSGSGSISGFALVGTAVFAACHFALLARVQRPAPLRVMVAFAFGLIHGFGFAGVLGEMAL
ncbi:MAG: HupE/UreJ family protein, partial [bacterium]|nr:HupE/UreJ family protein [bacterium]